MGVEASDGVVLDDEAEEGARALLRAHFERLKYWNASEAVEFTMSLGGAAARLETLRAVVPASVFTRSSRLLVSGTAAGSEMLAARRAGFGEVHGTEVDALYVDICRKRFRRSSGLFPILYDGSALPYEDEYFDLVLSGHIIEHTADPFLYLRQHVRVLKRGGFLFLEFPTRFHHHELHTNTLSLEWLPRPVRNAALKTLGGALSPLPAETKRRLFTIVDTGLRQISLGGVRRWLRRIEPAAELVHLSRPSPGVVRTVFRKGASG